MASLWTVQVLDNLSPNSNLNLDIYIEEVYLNHASTEVGIKIVGIVGDKYKLRVSEAVTSTLFYEGDINYRSKEAFSYRIALEKNKSYTFMIYDLHNVPLDTYTIKSLIDFKYVEPIVIVPAPTPEPELPKTGDISNVSSSLIICLLMVIAVRKISQLKRSAK